MKGGKIMEYPRNLTRADVKIFYASDNPIASYKDVFVVMYETGGFAICNAKKIIAVIEKYSEGKPSHAILMTKIAKLMSNVSVCDDEDKRTKVDQMRHELEGQFKYYSSAFACEYTRIK